jgi:hypothetical protein
MPDRIPPPDTPSAPTELPQQTIILLERSRARRLISWLLPVAVLGGFAAWDWDMRKPASSLKQLADRFGWRDAVTEAMDGYEDDTYTLEGFVRIVEGGGDHPPRAVGNVFSNEFSTPFLNCDPERCPNWPNTKVIIAQVIQGEEPDPAIDLTLTVKGKGFGSPLAKTPAGCSLELVPNASSFAALVTCREILESEFECIENPDAECSQEAIKVMRSADIPAAAPRQQD